MTTNASILEHRKRMRRIWRSKPWKAAMALFKALNPFCYYCGRPTQTSHHEEEGDYEGTDQQYIDAAKDGTPVCNACHTALRYGKRPCPVCTPRNVAEGNDVNYYNPELFDFCFQCLPGEVQARKLGEIRRRKEGVNELRRKLTREAYLRAKAWKASHSTKNT